MDSGEQNSTLFRTVSTALDFAYIFLMLFQKISQKKFPSERFTQHRIIIFLHIISGATVMFSGCFLHIKNEIRTKSGSPILDEVPTSSQEILFYVMGAMACCHTVTVIPLVPHVMGEKRITIPLYIAAASINLHNGLILILKPILQNAFLLWGSMNTFVYQRIFLLGLMLSDLDWELLYTYSLLSAASITYALSFQPQYLYMLVMFPVLYGPFHEKISKRFGFPVEDTAAGNIPTKTICSTKSTSKGHKISLKKVLTAMKATGIHLLMIEYSSSNVVIVLVEYFDYFS